MTVNYKNTLLTSFPVKRGRIITKADFLWYFWYYLYTYLLNLSSIEFAILTKSSITGTSTNTPTTVARVAPDDRPNSEMDTATDSSKKLDAPIIPHGAAME